jgi:transcriptional regulator with XRE-family HTH domain
MGELSPAAFFGRELRRHREVSGLTQADLGSRVFVSGAYIGQIESAARRPQEDLSKRLDEVFQTDGFFERMWPMTTASKHADYFAATAALEARAVTISKYSGDLVPGLMQTAGYAEAVIRAARPWDGDDQISAAVAARLDRAKILDDSTRPLLWIILSEAVLRPPIGGSTVMADQLRHVASLVRAGTALLQVLPFDSGAHAMMGGSVTLMSFLDEPPAAYVESVHSGQLLDDPAIVQRYAGAYDLARASALPPAESIRRVERAAREHDGRGKVA